MTATGSAAAHSARQASAAHADARLGLVRDALTPPVGMPPAPEADSPEGGERFAPPPGSEADAR